MDPFWRFILISSPAITMLLLMLGFAIKSNYPKYVAWKKKQKYKERLLNGEFPHIIFPRLAKFKRGDRIRYTHEESFSSSKRYYRGIDEDNFLIFSSSKPRYESNVTPGSVDRIHVVDFFVDYEITAGELVNRENEVLIERLDDNIYNEVLEEISEEVMSRYTLSDDMIGNIEDDISVYNDSQYTQVNRLAI